jgi:hypothetical protein
MTTLQVRSEDGTQTLVLRMSESDTIGDVVRHVSQHRASGSSAPFHLRTAFPAKEHRDTAQTLREAGLVPNATMMLRAE